MHNCSRIHTHKHTEQGAGQIAVVHNGKVVELGSHAELLAMPDGAYARLAAAQRGQH